MRLGPARPVVPMEDRILLRSVGELAAERRCCADCGRTPLVGEVVHRYPAGALVCALCRAGRGEDPLRSEAVATSERGHACRPAPRRAAA